jgi:hypothetical protein
MVLKGMFRAFSCKITVWISRQVTTLFHENLWKQQGQKVP